MKLSALICTAIGVAFLAVAAYFFTQELSFLQRAEHLTGTVTDLLASTSFQDQQTWTDYCPVVDFRTNEGKSVEYTSDSCSNPSGYKVGQKAAIFYDPKDPNATQMQDKYASQYVGVFIPLIIGVVFDLIGLGIYWAGLLRRARGAAAPVSGSRKPATGSGDEELEMLKEKEQVQTLKKQIEAQRRQYK